MNASKVNLTSLNDSQQNQPEARQAGTPPAKPTLRVSARQLADLAGRASVKDWCVLDLLDQHRFLTGLHIAGLVHVESVSQMAAIRAAARQMNNLENAGLVRRLPRLVGGTGGGSRRTIWHLTEAGVRLLRLRPDGNLNTGIGAGSPSQRRRFIEPSRLFLEHSLRVADARLVLERLGDGGWSGRQGDGLQLETIQTEPECWRHWTGSFGRPMTLRPDLYAEIGCGEFVDLWFIEVDMGSEHAPAIARKAEAYEAYRRSGREQAQSGAFPKVLWVVPNKTRAVMVERAIADSPSCDSQLHEVTTLGELTNYLTGYELSKRKGGEL